MSDPTWLDKLLVDAGSDTGGGGGVSTIAAFIQPAVGSEVTVEIGTSDPFTVDEPITVAGGGYYTVADVPDTTHLTIINTGGGANSAVGNTIPNGAIVASASLQVPSPYHSFDPKKFGCPWDNIHDDRPGWLRMMAAIRASADPMADIRIPFGMGYFSDNVYIDDPVTIWGRGSSDRYACGFRFPAGKGMFTNAGSIVTIGGALGADFSAVHDCTFLSELLIKGAQDYQIHSAREPSHFYEKGQCVLQYYGGSNTACFFRVTSAGGLSGPGSEPAGFSGTAAGVTTSDGDIVWTSEAYPADYQNNHVYTAGQAVFTPGDNRYYFVCTTGGTSAASDAALFDTTQDINPVVAGTGALIPDGPNTLVWQVHTHAALTITTTFCKFMRNHFVGFTGYCYHLQAHGGIAPVAYADFTAIHGGGAQWCGGGIGLFGFDCNDCDIVGFKTNLLGINRTIRNAVLGTGGHTVFDNGLANCFVGCAAQGSNAPAYRAGAASSGVFTACRSENAYADIAGGSSIFITYGQGGVTGTGIVIGPGGQNLYETIRSTPIAKRAGITQQETVIGAAHWFSTDDETSDNQAIALRYQPVNTSDGNAGTGWAVWGYGSQNNRLAIGLSMAKAAEGPGHWRDYLGHFEGSTIDGTAIFHGVSTLAITSKKIRGGSQIVGDIFDIPTGTAGAWRSYVVVTAGYRGAPWAALGGYTTGTVATGIFADVVEPTTNTTPGSTAGQFAYVCTTAGTSGGTEPVWGGATVTDGGVTWTRHPVPVYNRSGFVDDPVTAICPQAKTAWQDTAATDSGTVAAKTKVKGQRFHASTSSSGSNSVIATYSLDDNSVHTLDAVIGGKIAAGANAVAAKLSGSFVVNSGTVTRLGSDDVPTPKANGTLAGSTFDFNISGQTIQVRASPSVATATGWDVVVQDVEGID